MWLEMSSQKSVLFAALIVGVASVVLNTSGFFSARRSAIVHTKNGLIQGYLSTSRNGREYSAYVGIPYAKPPVGELRLESPVPTNSWSGILDASSFGPSCYQFDAMVQGTFLGDEDCLFLNVFVPNINNPSPLPVMVWIHGGGFLSGGARSYSPKYFIDEDCIVVTVNYRLGPLGFLNTGDGTIRGNMGLKDQRLALEWIQNNIKAFGGDKVTIFGESAGSASVHSHIISPSSKGLFRSAIMQSGSLVAPWSLTMNPIRQAKTYGNRVGCPYKTGMKEMVTCLKKLSPKQLLQPVVSFMIESPFTDPDSSFSPSIECKNSSDAMFIENPRILMKQGKFNKVPVIMGVTSGEGGLRTARLEAMNTDLDMIDKKWNELAPTLLLYDSKRIDVSKKIRQQYFGENTFSSDRDAFLKNFTVLMSDGWFFDSFHKAASNQIKQAPAYLYFYDFKSSLPGIYSVLKAVRHDDYLFAKIKVAMSMFKDYSKWFFGYSGPHEYGACHADDLVQLFSMDWILEIGQKSRDFPFSKNFVKVLVDFSKNDGVDKKLEFNGKEWPVILPKSEIQADKPLILMKLDKDGSVIEEPFFKRLAFWNNLDIRH